MHETLMWTINDTPVYADLFGGAIEECMHVRVVWRTYIMSGSSIVETIYIAIVDCKNTPPPSPQPVDGHE